MRNDKLIHEMQENLPIKINLSICLPINLSRNLSLYLSGNLHHTSLASQCVMTWQSLQAKTDGKPLESIVQTLVSISFP